MKHNKRTNYSSKWTWPDTIETELNAIQRKHHLGNTKTKPVYKDEFSVWSDEQHWLCWVSGMLSISRSSMPKLRFDGPKKIHLLATWVLILVVCWYRAYISVKANTLSTIIPQSAMLMMCVWLSHCIYGRLSRQMAHLQQPLFVFSLGWLLQTC